MAGAGVAAGVVATFAGAFLVGAGGSASQMRVGSFARGFAAAVELCVAPFAEADLSAPVARNEMWAAGRRAALGPAAWMTGG